uniref:VWFD domain-containing protein n=1 Tax=Ascaris lumbricoides TaxID=6252 RepID=A0A9J2P5V4_ASCLU
MNRGYFFDNRSIYGKVGVTDGDAFSGTCEHLNAQCKGQGIKYEMGSGPVGYRSSENTALYKLRQRRAGACRQIRRLPSTCREVSLRWNQKDIKGVDVLMYSFQLLDCS